jgi:hypothetical protein
MSTLHTPSEQAQPVTAPDLAALAAAIERLEAGQQQLEAEQRRLASAADHQTARITTMFSVMRLAADIEGVRIDEPLRVLEGGAKPDRRRTRRPALTAVGGSR